MPDILGTGISGLLAFQRALATTSHNISNVNTDGYSRQRTDLATRIPEQTGAGFIGSGVNAVGVSRVYDQFLSDQLRTQTSVQGRLDSYYNMASQVDNLLADPNAGLSPALQQFFDAVQGVADNPSSIPARQVMLSEGDSLVHRFDSVNTRLTALRDTVNSKVSTIVGEVNTLADSIANVNHSIVLALAQSGGQPPNDLLDKRDLLLKQLAEKVPVTTVPQDNGATNVFIGNGQVLVLGSDVNHLEVTPNQYDQFKYEVAIGNGGPNVTDFINGGELGGVLQFRQQILEPALNALGRVAIGLADTFNAQHAQGYTLNNQLGGAFFGFTGVTAMAQGMPSSANTGSGTVTYTVSDVSMLTTSDYQLSTTDGTNYTVTRLSDNTTYGPLVPDGLGNIDLTATDGLVINVAGAVAANDSFQISPTRNAAGDITKLINDPKGIAAALPFRSDTSGTNLGNVAISSLDISSATDLSVALPAIQAAPGITLTYDATNNWFNVTGAVTGTLAYNPATDATGKSFDLGTDLVPPNASYSGMTFQVSGTPLNGDSLSISENLNATGDNANALKLAALDTTPLLAGGTANYQSAYGQLVSDVGAKTHQADVDLSAQKAVVSQAQAAVDSVSGVNMDEEAANLVKFQQAYQASTQIINVAKTLFDTLLNAVG